jgi:GR25 family glycosyltransferase involved in LPS biosynthesis
MKFFIPHYTPLIERKKSIIEQFNKYNIIDYEFIEIYDREKLLNSDISKFERISGGEISLFLKQIEAIKIIVNNNINNAIILEDDSIFTDDFLNKLNYYIDNLPDNWDFIFFGECCDLHAKNINGSIITCFEKQNLINLDSIKNKQFFYKVNGSRGMSMYLINYNSAVKILDYFNNCNKITKPIDHWFNDFINNSQNNHVYWSEPTLIDQGSEINHFKSSLR